MHGMLVAAATNSRPSPTTGAVSGPPRGAVHWRASLSPSAQGDAPLRAGVMAIGGPVVGA